MNNLTSSPECPPLREQIFTEAYWPMADTPPPVSEVILAEAGQELSRSQVIRVGKRALINAAPEILSNETFGEAMSFGEWVEVKRLRPGTIVLYDLEAFDPAPMREVNYSADHAARLEMRLNMSPRELIRNINWPERSSSPRNEIMPGDIDIAGKISRHWFFYSRRAWLAIVPPGANRRSFQEYMAIPLVEPNKLKGMNVLPRMHQSLTRTLPGSFQVGKAKPINDRQHWYDDFRDGVQLVRSAELISPDYWLEAIKDDPGRKAISSYIIAMANGFGYPPYLS